MTAKKYIGTFKSNVAKDLRKLFSEGAVQASFIRRFRGKEELFAVFSGDERAQIILRDYAERRKRAAQLQIMFTNKTNFSR